MSAEIFTQEHKIVYYETDQTGKLSVPMIFNLAILASANHGALLGQGEEEIHANNTGWVVLQYDLTITKRPQEGDVVIIKTQAQEYNPYFAVRNFWLTTPAGDELVKIKSVFAMIDMEQRKMVRIPQTLMDAYQATKVKHIEKIPTPQAIDNSQPTQNQAYQVRYLDIDSNKHVNNAQYFDWLLDPLGAEFLQGHELVNLKIKYANEVRYGQTIESHFQMGTAPLVTLHQIKAGDTLNTEAELTWRSI
ncbi:acyl-[acyl-carrier-protein] thioesterase [Periweissella ghanensis]|uniref:Acyl-ACP thioesterase n=1 Tax=Periweissella ghanensis TaxID=467997 RepID=A0ABM8ZBX3_9LACO|nr:acyl-ACP thioesterase domain-containing protein [Periweissella ghanensis]MCM0601808.1 acyl-ACP thioesterase [Periweissella ghanensis]CAH0418795.1 hypothetical protein WGH24286_01232 [Periweissella ghanensis]